MSEEIERPSSIEQLLNKIEKMPLNIKCLLVSIFFITISFASLVLSIELKVPITQKIVNVIVAFFYIAFVFGIMSITITVLKHLGIKKKGT